MCAQAYAAIDGRCGGNRGIVVDVDGTVDRPGVFRRLSCRNVYRAIDLGGPIAVAIDGNVSSHQGQTNHNSGENSISASRAHKRSPYGLRWAVLYQHRPCLETSGRPIVRAGMDIGDELVLHGDEPGNERGRTT